MDALYRTDPYLNIGHVRGYAHYVYRHKVYIISLFVLPYKGIRSDAFNVLCGCAVPLAIEVQCMLHNQSGTSHIQFTLLVMKYGIEKVYCSTYSKTETSQLSSLLSQHNCLLKLTLFILY